MSGRRRIVLNFTILFLLVILAPPKVKAEGTTLCERVLKGVGISLLSVHPVSSESLREPNQPLEKSQIEQRGKIMKSISTKYAQTFGVRAEFPMPEILEARDLHQPERTKEFIHALDREESEFLLTVMINFLKVEWKATESPEAELKFEIFLKSLPRQSNQFKLHHLARIGILLIAWTPALVVFLNRSSPEAIMFSVLGGSLANYFILTNGFKDWDKAALGPYPIGPFL